MAMHRRMSQKKFLAIWIPILAFVLALVIVGTLVMNYFSLSLDLFFGRGAAHAVPIEGTENWDTQYYTNEYGDTDKALKAAVDTARKAANEGIVLMKNGEVGGKPLLPLQEDAAVTPFGYRYMVPVWCPLGSASTHNGYGDFNHSNNYSESMESALANNFSVNEQVAARMRAAEVVKTKEAPGTTPAHEFSTPNACAGSHTFLYEYDPSIYAGTESSCSGTVGIVFIGRETGEGGDLKWDAYEDGTPHQLTLSESEKETIRFAKKNCDAVVVVLNTANVMELGQLTEGEFEADAIVWMGYPGSIGCQSLSDILCGKVNPSGRTADLYMADIFSDPTFANTGLFTYIDSEFTGDTEQSFIEYEEGIYHGYKYYETADLMDPDFDYDAAVVYPFGYGLSYTTFEQELVSVKEDGDEVSVTVSVANTGDTDGKEVVQLYYSAPYTDFDVEYKIEKAAKVLLAFDKVEVASGESEQVTLTFNKEEMASYCYTRDNGDGTTGCYVLEEGDYVLTLGKNSHEAWDTATLTLPSTEWFDSSNPRQSEIDGQSLLDAEGNPTGVPAKQQSDPSASFIAASNHFEDMNSYMSKDSVTVLSRSDWEGTFPTAPDEASRAMDDEVKKALKDFGQNTFDPQTNEKLGNVEGSIVYQTVAPVSRQNNGLTLADMRGLDYYDPLWEDLLDQIDYSSDQLWTLLFTATYNIAELSSISLPASISGEGPTGIGLMTKLMNAADRSIGTCSYPSGVTLASTWNEELIYEVGAALAQECMNYPVNSGKFCGMTAPSINLRRSPFNGRNSEYMSEDPVLAGTIAAAQISGMADGGLYMIIKHFALNNQETGKTMNSGMCTWATEQTIREEYLKVYELVVKNARRTVKYIADENGTSETAVMRGATGIMTSFNRIGAIPTGGSYALITQVLRDEWGFQGIVQTDMPCQTNRDLILRAGGDLEMSYTKGEPADKNSPTMQWCIRRAVHDIGYTVVNSVVMNGVAPGTMFTYDMSPWRICMIAADCLLCVLVAAGVVCIVLRSVDCKKHPEKYGNSVDKK